MRAIGWSAYGEPEVLKLIEVEKPRPKTNEVLVRVHALETVDCVASRFLLEWGS